MNKLYLIDLCRYTIRQSLSDNGEYFPFRTAQDILEEIENE